MHQTAPLYFEWPVMFRLLLLQILLSNSVVKILLRLQIQQPNDLVIAFAAELQIVVLASKDIAFESKGS